MNKIFGLTKKGGKHWFASDAYADKEIEALVDPEGGSGVALPTAIPSPFARIDLVKTAFKNISKSPALCSYQKNNAVVASREDEKLVSDALDVFEILFNMDSLKEHLRILVWNREQELALLKQGLPEHKRLAETLELYLMQDARPYNFGRAKNLYLVEYDHRIIGCTSPATMCLASGNDLSHARIQLVGSDISFDEQYTPLYKRDEHFQCYVHAMFIAHTELQTGMRAFADYLGKSLDILREQRPALYDRIKRLQPGDLSRYTELDTGISGRTVEVLDGVTLRKRRREDMVAAVSNSDFVIDSVKYTGEQKPLVLQNFLTRTGFRYAADMWDSKTAVPYFDPEPDLSRRRLPGLTVQYPYLTVSDLLETQLVRLIYPIQKEKYFDGNLAYETKDEGKSYLLPLKPAFFDYFDAADLLTNLPGKPSISLTQGTAGSVKAILKLPVRKSGEYIAFERIYYAAADGSVLQVDPLQKKGAIVEHQIGLTIFPFIRIADPGIKPYYRAQFIDRDSYGQQKGARFEVRFFRDRPNEAVAEEALKYRRLKATEIATSEYHVLHENFDHIRIRNLVPGGASAVIIPRWPLYQPGNEAYRFAVDFGTTNTHIEYRNSTEGPKAFDIKRSEIQIGTLFHPDKLDGIQRLSADDIYTLIDYEFVPKLIGNGEDYQFPHRTVLAESHSLNIGASPTYALADFNIPFTYERKEDIDRVQPNLKWAKNETGNERRVNAYFETLILLMRNKVLFGGGNLAETRLTWFYPSSMKMGRKGQLEQAWTQLYQQYFNSSRLPVGITESLAPFYYFKGTNKIQGGAYKPVISIDIGGGTTDVVAFKSNLPLLMTSFKFAANNLFGDGFSELGAASSNGLIGKYLPYYKQLLERNSAPTLAKVLAAIQGKNRSEDINAFFFSIEHNRSLNGGRQFSYNSLLARDEDIKIVFLYFYAAIIYHVARLMKVKGIGLPKHLIFSGTGSKVLSIITADWQMLTGLSAAIFERVYGTAFDIDGMTMATEKDKPKEVTCKGGLMWDEQDLTMDIRSIKYTLTCLEDQGIDKLTYNELNDPVKAAVATEVEAFNRFFLELDKGFSFADNFNVAPAAFELFKKEMVKHLRDYLENGLSFNRKMDESSDGDKELEETLFFYPLAGSVNNLVSQLAQLSPIIS